MIDSAKKSLRKWNETYGERVKLQHILFVLSSCGVLISGLVALADAELGHTLVRISLMGYLVLAVNWVTWALAHTTIIEPLTKRSSTRKNQR